ncbi:MAG: hypothetical protein JWP59_1330 [Massilia sp.]|nr:hypothetical protein [Massilia sp.]
MDNLTHTIVGLAIGEAIHRAIPAEAARPHQQTRRRLLLSAGSLSSNFPDLDLLFTRLLPNPLGYLLHHRGHTHTFILEIPQALLLLALLWLLWPNARQLLKASATARKGLALAVVTGFILHIGMDAMNSYGVHPFYPFDMRWLFGDLVFIIEPVFWVGAGVPLIMSIGRRWARRGWCALLALVLAACTAKGYLHWGSLLLLGLLGLLAAAAARQGLAAGLGMCIAFVGAQAVASHAARGVLTAELAQRAPASTLVDAALTAYPANPLCWNFAAIERGAGDTYHVRRGVISLAPAALPVTACPAGLTGRVTGAASGQRAIGLLSDDSASLRELRSRAEADCWMRAWLRFARTPLLDGAVASDMRFGTNLAPNFTTIDLDRFKGRACPAPVPPWGMPRGDLLAP